MWYNLIRMECVTIGLRMRALHCSDELASKWTQKELNEQRTPYFDIDIRGCGMCTRVHHFAHLVRRRQLLCAHTRRFLNTRQQIGSNNANK